MRYAVLQRHMSTMTSPMATEVAVPTLGRRVQNDEPQSPYIVFILQGKATPSPPYSIPRVVHPVYSPHTRGFI
jgi:hypothetical protein